ncbi:hypothetical protein GGI21_003686, partial [Coemansia aciculifera]
MAEAEETRRLDSERLRNAGERLSVTGVSISLCRIRYWELPAALSSSLMATSLASVNDCALLFFLLAKPKPCASSGGGGTLLLLLSRAPMMSNTFGYTSEPTVSAHKKSMCS